jgi:hypothetical protein
MAAAARVAQGNQIQSLLEELTIKEEARTGQLKQRLEELSTQLRRENSIPAAATEVQFGDSVTLHVGGAKFDKVIRATALYDDFASSVRSSAGGAGPGFVGFRDDQGRLIWVRTNQDVHFMFTWYFAQGVPFMQAAAISPAEIAGVQRFALRKELPYKEGMPVFRCECAGPDGPLIYLAVPATSNREEAVRYLEGIFGAIASLMFVDEADDVITIDSVESWEYCIETAASMAKAGKFSLLLVETS